MLSLFYKWFFLISLYAAEPASAKHPMYISVTEIENNAKEQTLEVSCRIFTDDFEKTLRAAYRQPVDLLKASENGAMGKLVNDYLQRHLFIAVNGKPARMQ